MGIREFRGWKTIVILLVVVVLLIPLNVMPNLSLGRYRIVLPGGWSDARPLSERGLLCLGAELTIEPYQRYEYINGFPLASERNDLYHGCSANPDEANNLARVLNVALPGLLVIGLVLAMRKGILSSRKAIKA